MNKRFFAAIFAFACICMQTPAVSAALPSPSAPAQSAAPYDPSFEVSGYMSDSEATGASAGENPQVAPYNPYSPVVYKPEVALTSYSVVNGNLVAGGRVTLRLTFENTSRTKGIFDLLLTYDTSVKTIYPVYGESNTSFVTAIAPGGIYHVEKEFHLAKSASEITELAVDMRYQGVGSGSSTGKTAVYLPVFGANSFTAKLNVGNTIYAGTPMVISGYCANSGGRDLVDLRMRLEGDISEGSKEVDLGNVADGGQTAVQEAVVFPQAMASGGLNITFSFSDAEGNRFELAPQTYAVTVLEAPGVDNVPDVEAPRSFMPAYLGGGALFLVVVAAFLLYGRKSGGPKGRRPPS